MDGGNIEERGEQQGRGVRVRGGGGAGQGGGGGGGRGGGQGGERRRTIISDEIRATVIDHVFNHGLPMREAGQRVQPNLSRFSVASIKYCVLFSI